MEKEELEKQYSCSRWSHRMSADEVIAHHILTIATESEKAKAEVECQIGRTYGDTENQKLDIFGADRLPGDAPIFVYIHGGYWQELSREISCYMVRPLCKAGAVVVIVGYDLAPNASMPEIVSQCRKAMSYILNLAQHRGSSGVYICGHSAGGHLTAMMLSVDWMSECMLSNSIIKGAVLVSSVYDLRPLVNTYVNDAIKMTMDIAWDNSPWKLIDNIINRSSKRQIIVVVGEHDSPEFKRQSQEFEQKLKENGVSTKYIEIKDTDHFNVVENLQNDDYILTKEILNLMKLNLEGVVNDMSKSGLT